MWVLFLYNVIKGGILMEQFKVRVFVYNNARDALSDQIFEMKMIPRKGDFLHVNYTDKFEGHSVSTVVEVVSVYLEVNNTKMDATIHVKAD